MRAEIGLMVEGQNGLNWQNWEQILHAAERGGYQCVFRSDHYRQPRTARLRFARAMGIADLRRASD